MKLETKTSSLVPHTDYLIRVSVKSLSRVRLFATSWTVAYQAPPSIGFSRQEYWSGLPFPSPGDLPNPGMEPGSPALEADTLTSEPPGKCSNVKQCFLSFCESESVSHSVMLDSLQSHGLRSTRLLFSCNSLARILEWVAISFSGGSSQPRDQTLVFHIVGRCFTI